MKSAVVEPRRICLFTDSLEPSGVGVHLALLIEGLAACDCDLHLVCPPTAAAASLIARAQAVGATYHPLRVRAAGDLADFMQLIALLRRERIDLFHNQIGVTWEGHFGTLAARQAGVRAVIATEHLPYVLTVPQETAQKAMINRLLDGMITVSEEAQRSHTDSGTTRSGLVCTVPNGVASAPPVSRAAARAALGIHESTPLLGTVARLYEQKGHRYLVAAMLTVLAHHPDAGLVLIGDGPLRWELEGLTCSLGVGGRVWFLGARADARALIPAFDVAVLPSLFEGLPLFMLEAMAAGVPTVGTRVCGTAETIRDGETGLLVPVRDAAALGLAVVRLLDDPALAGRMGAAGLARFQAEFHVARMVQRTVAVYKALWARTQGVTPVPSVHNRRGHQRVSPARAATRAISRVETLALLSDYPAG